METSRIWPLVTFTFHIWQLALFSINSLYIYCNNWNLNTRFYTRCYLYSLPSKIKMWCTSRQPLHTCIVWTHAHRGHRGHGYQRLEWLWWDQWCHPITGRGWYHLLAWLGRLSHPPITHSLWPRCWPCLLDQALPPSGAGNCVRRRPKVKRCRG